MEEPKLGQVIEYVDPTGKAHPALVTNTFKSRGDTYGVNLVFVSINEEKTDPYGRQIERQTSIVHESVQPAPAFFWREA